MLIGHDSLARYARAPERLEAALAALVESDLDTARAPGEWTIRQLVHHIVEGDLLWAGAIRAALGSPGCLYRHDWYTTDNRWAETLDYAGRPIEPALALFRANRAHIVELVEHLPDAWAQPFTIASARYPEGRPATAGDVVAMQARHADEHIAEIAARRQ